MRIIILGLCLLALLGHARAELPQGASELSFQRSDGERMVLFTYRPAGAGLDAPVVIVLSGLLRNAATYRDEWREAADRYGYVVVAPRFSQRAYPGAEGYNLGRLNDRDGQPAPREKWAFTAIDELFEWLRSSGHTSRQRYYLYGNSAGCQFVHRMLTLLPDARVEAAVCAAAGWWTLPDRHIPWPYGLADAPVEVGSKELAELFARPLLVTVGAEDDADATPPPRHSPGADAQGSDRRQRAWFYYRSAHREASDLGLPFAWSFSRLPGVAHSGARTSRYAAVQFDAFERLGRFDLDQPQPQR
ncbi:hypothetical protein [Halotalea alkalilenta]|uniref:Alpha/beta hydrolase n=1 Tax=Halotalea alkalilenta TaxID=376489 RepID=A0A172YG82_9GAMM|nr:hypothetical protein [Halotalea alkalilenta]ANF58278.1 hypothetical protein A5892_13030 [Halotalea alkalilenta]